jgi:hypothetical protein
VGHGLGSCSSGQGQRQVVGCDELKIRAISWLTEDLLASQEGLGFVN